MAAQGAVMFGWVGRFLPRWLRLRRRPARRALSAQLIAPIGEFVEAERAASPAVARILRAGRRSHSEIDQIGAAISARLTLAKKMTDAELVRYIQHLQNRYRAAVGAATYARYMEGVPTDMLDNPKKRWAELQTLSYRLRLAYSITHVRDSRLAFIRLVCTWGLVIALGVVVGAIFYRELSSSHPIVNFMIVAAVGLGGALTSIARRANQIVSSSPLDDDPVIQASALQQGLNSLYIAGLTGPIFALTVLVIFMADALKVGELTPTFQHAVCTAHCDTPDFRIFQYVFWFNSRADAAKMLLWAFAAGFAEQLVPDVLDRFTKAADREEKGDNDAGGASTSQLKA